jgi:hypothetical protein
LPDYSIKLMPTTCPAPTINDFCEFIERAKALAKLIIRKEPHGTTFFIWKYGVIHIAFWDENASPGILVHQLMTQVHPDAYAVISEGWTKFVPPDDMSLYKRGDAAKNSDVEMMVAIINDLKNYRRCWEAPIYTQNGKRRMGKWEEIEGASGLMFGDF